MFLVDTNVISEASRALPHPKVLAWLATIERPTLSVITLGEIEFGVSASREPNRQIALRMWFDEVRRNAEIIAVNEQVAVLAGRLRAENSKRGRQLTHADALIAATAAVTKRTIATRNVKDFEGCGITLFNPFAVTSEE